MMHQIATITLLLGATVAQQSTLSIPFYGYDGSTFAASVLGVSNGATTLQLACPSDDGDCGLFPSETLTYGPSTYHIDMALGNETAAFTGTQDCSVGGTTTAICKESNTGSEANFPGTSTTTYAGTEIQVAQVVITAGAQMLSAGAGAAGSSAPSTASATTTGGSGASTTGTSGTIATGGSSLTAISGTVTSSSGSVTSSATTTSSSGAAGSSAQVPFSGFWAAAAGMLGLVLI